MALTRLGTNAITSVPSSAITALPAGVGGKVLQVVTATDSTERTTSSISFTAAGSTLAVAITPSSTSSKIFAVASSTIGSANSDGYCITSIYRDATNLGHSTSGMGISVGNGHYPVCITILDSPSSNTSLTYQVYFRSDNAAKTAVLNRSSVKGSITLYEIAG